MRIILALAALAWSSVASAQPSAPAQAPPPKPFDCSAPEHRQFDFWIGEWDVVPNPETAASAPPPPSAGQKPASNVITKAHDGCVLIENWTASGQTGQSFNIYDRTSRRWVRLTFFPMGPDKVRQFSETLNMDGTWTTGYDLIYTRRKPAS